ncbi:MAG: tetratricopeptide repeat protein [Spirochaetaceae bacterium]|jgi:hypothetical protein|nr:tetratricopeptide repeat protein [Spirochaetaceae bacterium]
MPSLQNLEKFRQSFLNIGNEPEINRLNGIARDEYSVPDEEPAPLPPPPEPVSSNEDEAADFSGEGEGDASFGYDSDGGGFGTNFDDILGTPAEDLTPPPAPEDFAPAAGDEPEAPSAGDEFDLSSVLDGLGDESPEDTPSGDPAAASADVEAAAGDGDDVSDLLAGFGEEAPPDESALSVPPPEDGAPSEDGASGGTHEEVDLSDLLAGFGEEAPAGEPESAPDGGAPDGGAPSEAPAAASADAAGGEEDLSDLLAGFGEEAPAGAPDESAAADEASAEVPEIAEISDEELSSLLPEQGAQEEAAGDSFDNFSFPGMEDEASPLPSLDSLDIPGLGKSGGAGGGRAAAAEKAEEAAQISDDDLKRLLETLDAYPLNLRIACEQILSDDELAASPKAKLAQLLINGGGPHEAAELAGRILKKNIVLPKGALKKNAEQLEAEQKSVGYIVKRKVLPIFTLVTIIALFSACVSYLIYQFVYKPVRAETLYKQGYTAIGNGEYERANQRFADAFKLRQVKDWFYRYAEAFRDERQYLYAERKYDELLICYPRDKKGALDYAYMESDYLRAYEKADKVVREHLLDYYPDDREGLLALGDINLDWADSDSEQYYGRYEEARLAYARYITVAGQTPVVMERMLKYFIRTDNLGEVIPIQESIMRAAKVPVAAATLAELGGYLLDKRLEVTEGVPDASIEKIAGIKDVLIRAVRADDIYRRAYLKRTGRAPPPLPEPHYQLGRYYHLYNAPLEERYTLETAAAAFDAALIESPKRTRYRIDTQRMLADVLIHALEWFKAEEALLKGVAIYENALERTLIKRRYADAGKLYATLGDIEYFINNEDTGSAIRNYLAAERNGWAPPELLYRLGAAYYHIEDYPAALQRFFTVSMQMPYNRRLLNALGNVSYMRNDFFAAQGYFNRLIRLLEQDRLRFPVMTPNERPDHADLLQRMMVAQNNLGVTMNALAYRSGNPANRTQALALFSEAARYSDMLSRDEGMVRPGLSDPAVTGKSLPYLNLRNTLYPTPGSSTQLYIAIDKDVQEPSEWERLAERTGTGAPIPDWGQ